MPQTSDNKTKLVNFLIEEGASNILLHLNDDDSYWKTMNDLDERLILSNHRFNYQNVSKCLESKTNVLDYLDDGHYQQMLRVSGDQFTLLLSLIKDSAQFNNAQTIRQFSIEPQLPITLYRLGSSGESAAIRKVALFTQEGSHFSSSQWRAGDSAYPLLITLITPFRTNSQQMDYLKRKAFNLRHSRYFVRIEHCFGILKECFGSLKELRIRIQNVKSHILCSNWFIVCCILHNIFRATSNDIEYVDNIVVDSDEESDEFPSYENG
ncbi:PREDICTED: uncharacterized protein LOC108977300 [Bactrocera latifrons]|uniref:uncharacterized protein LOC108977300 n=1 Tax=Bactrocera latifrons TaxID=174628 RepID=UPI0008DC9463|nr:PREDICTED: uncharacterized protein LOC108977300 [Bactrocera latifrons]